MSTSSAINPKGSRVPKPGNDPATWAEAYLGSTVGQKVITALTGLGLTGFVFFHMIGNLKIFSGQDAINSYAYFLKHELGLILWGARIGLLGLFVAHLALVIRLKMRSTVARPIGYVVERRAQATVASRTMLYSGIVIFSFVVLHLAHYTFGLIHEVELPGGTRVNYLALTDVEGRHDVYNMTVAGLRNPILAGIYLVSQLFLALHLSHGIQSTIQTLGLKGSRFSSAWVSLGYLVAAGIFVGNAAIVLAIWSGYLPPIPLPARA
jgi:succinate dehydrogenase / fumarate reductase cytochrome b subunit